MRKFIYYLDYPDLIPCERWANAEAQTSHSAGCLSLTLPGKHESEKFAEVSRVMEYGGEPILGRTPETLKYELVLYLDQLPEESSRSL